MICAIQGRLAGINYEKSTIQGIIKVAFVNAIEYRTKGLLKSESVLHSPARLPVARNSWSYWPHRKNLSKNRIDASCDIPSHNNSNTWRLNNSYDCIYLNKIRNTSAGCAQNLCRPLRCPRGHQLESKRLADRFEARDTF
jgi:hypothetical protein